MQGIVLILTVLLILTLDRSGALHVYGLGDMMGQRFALAVSLVLLLLAAVCVLVAFLKPHHDDKHAPSQPSSLSGLRQRLLVVLIIQAWFASLSNLLHFIVPVVHPALAVVLAAITLVLIAACVLPYSSQQLSRAKAQRRKDRTKSPISFVSDLLGQHMIPWLLSVRWVLLVAVGAGVLVRLVGMAYVPIDPARDDMLPLVAAALNNLIAGQSPYTIYHMPWELPLTYLPITWLAYGPAYLLNLDIRLTNLLAELGVGGLLAWLAIHTRQESQDVIPDTESFIPRATVEHSMVPDSVLLWAWFFVQPTAINWSLATTIPIFWLVLCAVLVLLLKEQQVLAAIVCGLCIATSPLTSLLMPFVVLQRWRTQSWAGVARFVGIAGSVAALCIIPFLAWSPHDFVLGVWRWFNDNTLYPQMRWDMDHTWARQIGVSGVFWRHGWVWLLKPIQTVLMLTLAGLFWLAGAWLRLVPLFVVAAVVLFVVFNPVLWPYVYTPAVVAALVAVAHNER